MTAYTLESKNHAKNVKWAQANGLDVSYRQTAAEVIATIQAAYPDLTEYEIEGDGEAMPEVVSGPNGKLSANYRDDPKITVNIPTDVENGGASPVPVCVNGDSILIKRNTDVRIYWRHYLALKNAIQTDYRQEPGDNGTTRLIGEDRHAFRFSASDGPSEAEIAAWHERTKDIGKDKAEDKSLAPTVDNLASALLKQLQAGAAA